MKTLRGRSKLFFFAAIACAGALVFTACGKSGKDEAAPAGETPAVQTAGPATAAEAFAGWVEYVSDPMGFTVKAPQPLTVSQDTSKTADGDTEIYYYMAEMGPVTYGIVCNDFTEDFAAKIDQKEFLDKGIKGFVDSLSGTVSGEREVALGAHNGREIVMSGSSQGIALYGKARFFLIGRRLYQVAYLAEQGKEAPAAVDYFLDSFQLK